MAGTNKSYRRKDNPGTPVVKQAINSQGKLESYNEWDLYLYNPSNNTAVMNVSGVVTSNPGVDSEYIEHGPERINQTTTTATGINSYGEVESYEIWNGTAGKQTHIINTPVAPPEPPSDDPSDDPVDEPVTSVPYDSASSLILDGVNDIMELSSVTTPNATAGSISVWIKTTNTSTQYILLQRDSTDTGNKKYVALTIQNSVLKFKFYNSSYTSRRDFAGTTIVTDGVWHHILMSSTGTGYRLYIDGVEEGSMTINQNDGKWFGHVDGLDVGVMGCRERTGKSPSSFFAGNIDELVVWDSDQSANIDAIYNNKVAGDVYSLSPVSHWSMGDGAENSSGTTVYDMTTGGINGTLVGDPVFSNDIPE